MIDVDVENNITWVQIPDPDTNTSDCMLTYLYDIMTYDTTTDTYSNRTGFKISGSKNQKCSWQITPQNETSTMIWVLNGSLFGTDHLYIEQQDGYENCYSKILVFERLNHSCPVILKDNRYKIHLQGDISLEILISENSSSVCPQKTLLQDGDNEQMSSSSTCTTLLEYDDLIACQLHELDIPRNYLSDWTYWTQCDVNCPERCRCSLANKEVIYDCLDDKYQLHTTRSFLTFPSNISHLNFSHSGLQMLTSDAFESIGSQVIRLDLGFNSLRNINFLQHLPNLQELGVTYNQISSIEKDQFKNLRNLTELWLYKNSLVELEQDVFHGLVNLDKLIMWGNNLSEIQSGLFEKLALIQVLEISHNSFTSLQPGVFKNLLHLKYLGLRHGRLLELKSDVFSGLHTLANLYIDQNNLMSIEDGTFDGLFQLRSLVLSSNQLTSLPTDVFKDLGNLIELDLSFNNIHLVPELSYLTNLKYLDLKGNSLAKVQASMFSSVQNTTQVMVLQPETCACYLQHVLNCSATQPRSEYLTCNRLLSVKALAIFTWIFGFAAVLGNIMVLLWRNAFEKGAMNVTGLLLSNLAMSDFIMGVYMIIIASADIYFGNYFPLQAEEWRTGTMCRIAGALVITSSEASVLFITLISIDRFICIKYPYTTRRLRPKSAKRVAVIIWLTSMVLGVIPSVLAGVNRKFYDNSHVCIGLPLTKGVKHQIEQKSVTSWYEGEAWYTNKVNITSVKGYETNLYYSIFLFFGFNFLCFFIILACYEEILRAVYRASKAAGKKREMKEQIRLCTKVAVIVATDFFCWFPIIIIGILGQSGAVTIAPGVFAWVVTLILPINSAINPYLYTLAAVISSQIKLQYTDVMQTQNSPLPSPHLSRSRDCHTYSPRSSPIHKNSPVQSPYLSPSHNGHNYTSMSSPSHKNLARAASASPTLERANGHNGNIPSIMVSTISSGTSASNPQLKMAQKEQFIGSNLTEGKTGVKNDKVKMGESAI